MAIPRSSARALKLALARWSTSSSSWTWAFPCDMEVFRLFHGTNDPLDGTGAAIYGARWNPVGHAVVYAAWTFEGALLEKLVHSNIGHPPPNVRAAEISIPDDIQVPILDVGTVTDWQRETNSQAIGKQWLKEGAAVA